MRSPNMAGTTTPPVIDVAPLLGSPGSWPVAADDCIALIDEACSATGFFVAVGHGLEPGLSRLFEQARRFFGLDQAVKEAVPRGESFGFVPHRDLALDRNRLLGATEYLDLPLDPDAEWEIADALAAAVEAHQGAALRVAGRILAGMAVALGLDTDFFARRMEQPECKLRLLHYLPVAAPVDGSPAVTTEPHTDYGAVTLLATDGVAGLEILPRGGEWTAVESPEGGLVVNLGDMLARWTNLRYASTPHRVVASAHQHRYSIPFFVNPDPDVVVESVPSCVSEENPSRFGPVTAGEFLAGRIAKTIPEPAEF